MVKIISIILTVVLGLILLGCSGIERKEMSEGERLFRANCRACHVLPNANDFSGEEWVILVKRYADPLNIPPEKQKKILDYLLDFE